MEKRTYALSYNNALRHANWVSWELSNRWLGATDRTDNFQPDAALPAGFTQVLPSDFAGSGFDRGHICPSADRTKNVTDNTETFLMTNMIPQAPDLNRNSWSNLEQYARSLAQSGYTLYITAGAYGTGGTGSKGAVSTLASGVNVPERVYKVILATKKSEISSVGKEAIVIATDFPNDDDITTGRDWVRFLTTPEEIEKNTDIQLFKSISPSVRSDFSSRLFEIKDSPISIQTACKQYNNRDLFVGKEGGCYYFSNSGNKTYVDKKLCDCN